MWIEIAPYKKKMFWKPSPNHLLSGLDRLDAWTPLITIWIPDEETVTRFGQFLQ